MSYDSKKYSSNFEMFEAASPWQKWKKLGIENPNVTEYYNAQPPMPPAFRTQPPMPPAFFRTQPPMPPAFRTQLKKYLHTNMEYTNKKF